ncbi:MAG TPA: hypothetical protein ENI23_14280 [bacterium]|nr:hypothetical protein [bacterium]
MSEVEEKQVNQMQQLDDQEFEDDFGEATEEEYLGSSAPESVDFDLEDIADMDTLPEGADSFKEPVIEVKFPHWRLGRDEFLAGIQPFIDLNSTGNNDVVSKSVMLSSKEGVLTISGNNKDTYIEKKIQLKSIENNLQDIIIIDSNDIKNIARNSAAEFIIFNEPDNEGNPQYKCMVLQGSVNVDVYTIESGIFSYITEPTENVDLSTFKVPECKELFPIMLAAMSLSVRPEDKRIIFKDGSAIGSFITTLVSFDFPGVDSLILRAVDISFLNSLVKNLKEGTFVISAAPNRVYCTGEHFKISFVRTTSGLDESYMEMLRIKFANPIGLDLTQQRRLFHLLSVLNNQTGLASFEASSTGTHVVAKSRQGSISKFEVSTDIIKETITMGVEMLKKIFSFFASRQNVTMSRGESAILFETQGIKVIVSHQTD